MPDEVRRLNDGETPIDLSVVVPAYNEAAAIGATVGTIASYLARQPFTSEIVVVDDGSTDGTDAVLRTLSADVPGVRVLRHASNQGKGSSVRSGMLDARGRFVFFMDADLSVPIDELGGAFAALSQGDAAILIGSRKIAGARIERRQPLLREYLGHGFTYLARLLLWPSIVDFTCGFKGFRRVEARRLFSMQTSTDWAFDAEVLYLARLLGLRVVQHPVRWSHRSNSRVRFPGDIWRSFVSLLRIRAQAGRALTGYAASAPVLPRQQDCEK
jgi:dolichyl-phosphate beta-glucosyltransferase